MRENWNESGHFEDNRTPHEVVRERIEMLGAVFNRKITEQLICVFQDILGRYPPSVLKRAFSKAELQMEKFPTPKMMAVLCGEETPSQAWKYDFRPSFDQDVDTGAEVSVLIDPDPTCRRCRSAKSEHPLKIGEIVICKEAVLRRGDEVMYRPQDCPEGRAFLAKLRQLGARR